MHCIRVSVAARDSLLSSPPTALSGACAGPEVEGLAALQRLTHLDLGGVPAPAVARLAHRLPALASLALKLDVDRDVLAARRPSRLGDTDGTPPLLHAAAQSRALVVASSACTCEPTAAGWEGGITWMWGRPEVSSC